MPAIFPIIFILIWNFQSVDVINNMDGPPLFIFNLVICYIIMFISFSFRQNIDPQKRQHLLSQTKQETHGQHNTCKPQEDELAAARQKHEYYKRMQSQKSQNYEKQINDLQDKLHRTQSELRITKENFNINLRGIEDKCKAINFVIGRVYSDRKGGSPTLREKLAINRELYNKFSEMSANFDDKYAINMLNILERIYHQLLLLEQPENSVIKLHSRPELPVQRDNHGNDKILDVLAKNDKDPIMDYHNEAKEVAEKLINFIKLEYVNSF
jgi:hypothetical protein